MRVCGLVGCAALRVLEELGDIQCGLAISSNQQGEEMTLCVRCFGRCIQSCVAGVLAATRSWAVP